MSEHLPPRFAELERELDRIARRMLAEELEGDPTSAPEALEVTCADCADGSEVADDQKGEAS